MATIANNWQKFQAPVSTAVNWSEMKLWLVGIEEALPDRAVYVIRTKRPFAISYPKKPSPVLYIGEGNLQQRFRNYMRKWIVGMGRHLPGLELDVRFQQVVVRNNAKAHREVEADLLYEFGRAHGVTPLFNKQYEANEKVHNYGAEFFDVLRPGRGPGFHWGLLPLATNASYPSFAKGQFWE